MKRIKAKEKTGVFLSGQQIVGAGYTQSSPMSALGSWESYMKMQSSPIISVLISGSMFSTGEEAPSVDINREVGEVPIVILEYEDGFTVYPLEIDGVVSQGDTLPQAIRNVEDAISLHIESFGKKKLIPRDERAVRVFVSKTMV